MDIDDLVTTDYAEADVKTPVSRLRGSFESADVRVIVLTNEGEFAGIVAQSDLLSSHHPPEERAMNVKRDPPTVQRREDVREVARLMVENELKLLPVFEGERFDGVVTASGILDSVRENLDVLDVSDVYTQDLLAVERDTGLGRVIHLLRNNKITRVPVLEDGRPVGMISVYDMVEFVVRKMDREQGGQTDGFDGHGGEGSREGYRSHGGYGERAGDEARMLDLPARDVMATPAATIEPTESLGTAVDEMLENDYSSLVVVDSDTGEATGIVTKTDALRALTWTEEDHIPVQVFNVDLMETLTREDIAKRIEEIDGKYEDMFIEEANVVFHKHKERLRGLPLVLATIRLFTDRGRFSGNGEGYGAERAFDQASETIEENVLQEKSRQLNTYNRKQSPKKSEEIERLLGWWLETG